MPELQGGLGFGINTNQLIFVFTTESALSNFVNQGWEFGGQANLSAMVGGQGVVQRRRRDLARGLPLPDHRDRTLRDADHLWHEVLRGP